MQEDNINSGDQDAVNLHQSQYDKDGVLVDPTLQERHPFNNRVEDYLDRVLASMVKTVPEEARSEIRRDMREHVYQLIAAQMERGREPAEAVTAALRQFGRPSLVARRWLDELEDSASDATYRTSPIVAIAQPFKFASILLGCGIAIWTLVVWLLDFVFRGAPGGMDPVGTVVLPSPAVLIVGMITGSRFASRFPILGMLLAQAVILPLWIVALLLQGGAFQHMHFNDINWLALIFLAATILTVLAPFGCFGALVGACYKKIVLRMRQRAVTR